MVYEVLAYASLLPAGQARQGRVRVFVHLPAPLLQMKTLSDREAGGEFKFI